MTEEDKIPNKDIIESIAKKVKESDPTKPGYKSTEFWITVIVTLVGLVAMGGGISKHWAAQVIGGIVAIISVTGYQFNRTSLKKLALKVLNKVTG